MEKVKKSGQMAPGIERPNFPLLKPLTQVMGLWNMLELSNPKMDIQIEGLEIECKFVIVCNVAHPDLLWCVPFFR